MKDEALLNRGASQGGGLGVGARGDDGATDSAKLDVVDHVEAGVALPTRAVFVLGGVLADGVHQVAVAGGDAVRACTGGGQVVVKGVAQGAGAGVADGGTGGGLQRDVGQAIRDGLCRTSSGPTSLL